MDDALHQPREPAKVVHRRIRRERVHSAQARAAALLTSTILAVSSNNSSDGAGRSSTSSGLGSLAACLDGDGGGGGGRAGVDVLQAARGEGGAVCADGEGLEVGHSFIASGGGVDAEDHAFAAVDAVLLFAVEPWERC